jgi:hypothetical protein
MPKCPWPQLHRELANSGVNRLMEIISRPNPERRDLSGGRLELLVLHVSAHRSTHAGHRAGRFHQKGEYPLLKNKSWEQRKVPLIRYFDAQF